MLSENILVEKYQVIVLFPWNSKRAVSAIHGFGYNTGYVKPSIKQNHIRLYYLLENACIQHRQK